MFCIERRSDSSTKKILTFSLLFLTKNKARTQPACRSKNQGLRRRGCRIHMGIYAGAGDEEMLFFISLPQCVRDRATGERVKTRKGSRGRKRANNKCECGAQRSIRAGENFPTHYNASPARWRGFRICPLVTVDPLQWERKNSDLFRVCVRVLARAPDVLKKRPGLGENEKTAARLPRAARERANGRTESVQNELMRCAHSFLYPIYGPA